VRAALRRQPQRQTLESFTLPAPVGGMNTVSPGLELPSIDCLYAYNLIAAEYGIRSRLGSREWCTNLDGEVRTELPFMGSSAGNNRNFATTQTGIWDVSSSSASPTRVLTFASAADPAGWGVSTAIVNAAGVHYLLYFDEQNGYHVYSEATSTWVKVAMGAGADQINGVDPDKFVFGTVWKNRLWCVERGTAAAWYLDVNAIYGTATKFNFGSKFRAGGPLVGLWSWTRDGGAGIDDRLVAISGGGDVAIYEGYDPTDASKFQLVGVWSIGSVPAGRKIASPFGGDLLMLSTLGVLPVSVLSVGSEPRPEQYRTWKIANMFNVLASTYRSIRGWSIVIHPEDNALVLLVPTGAGLSTIQLAMSFGSGGWFQYRDLPMSCADAWDGKLYFGTPDGRVLINDGYVDGITLADPNSYTPVQWSLLSRFTNGGDPRQKRIQMIRPLIRTEGSAPSYQAKARYGFDLTELDTVSEAPLGGGAGEWDSAIWDSAIWSGAGRVTRKMGGAAGIGSEVAIAMRGTAKDRTTILSVDVFFDRGGVL
jgi:hypothetical protein